MPEIIPYIDEGFIGVSETDTTITFSYAFAGAILTIATGTTTVYDFESDDEGFTIVSETDTTACRVSGLSSAFNTSFGVCP